ncbi:hypothetical protein AMQ84_26660 [Paenibacillus riograndensis]|uniref:Uncharacterized protein n=1 Tax=Paenibacillus riograndensis TaxID=483937 RepID=A0A132TJM1_9BACL|nr:hypothetical protein AMQ84_26660 [Paenibacillus riograndensis]
MMDWLVVGGLVGSGDWLDGGTTLIELKNFMNRPLTPSGKRFIIELVWLMEVSMWEKVSLIQLVTLIDSHMDKSTAN